MLEFLTPLLAQQQIAIGMIGATFVGALVYSLKALPSNLWAVLREQFSVTLAVEGQDLIYDHLNLWFSRHQAVKRVRRMMLQQEFDYDRSDWRWKFTLGRGWHLIWTHGRPMLVHRDVSEGGEIAKLLGKGTNQRMSVITIGRDQALLRRIVEEAEEIYNSDGHVRIYYWNQSGYDLADRRPPRSMDTVFLPDAQKRRLIADVRAFTEAKAAYRERGTPYRRGYLFEGPPGTGKTSLIFALAGLLGRAVFVINLSNVHGDNALLAAFNAVGNDGVVVIEDIDTAEITKDREVVAVQQAEQQSNGGGPPMLMGAQSGRVTLSGLLNAIDGVAAREGRILFVTSNHASELDPALLRSGRIDRRETIDRLDADTAWAMFQAFRPDGAHADFERLVLPRLPIAAADLQNLLQAADDGAEVITLHPAGETRRAALGA
jgi:hypothetical protein